MALRGIGNIGINKRVSDMSQGTIAGKKQGGFAAGYDPSTVSEFERAQNDSIARAAQGNWGGRVVYDPSTGKLIDLSAPNRPVKDGDRLLQTARKSFLQNSIRKQALDNAQRFDVDKYVQGESDVYRRNLAQQVVQQQKSVQANANARGMLNSGQRQKGEAQVAGQANEDFAQKRNDLVQSALKQKQTLMSDPLTGMANQSISNLQNKYNEVAGQQGGGTSGQDFAAIGAGLGQIAGSKSTTTTLPIKKEQ